MSEKIPNIGPKTQAQLRQIGIRTHEDLARFGVVDAFVRLKRAGFKPSLNALYALEGALSNRHWTSLSPEEKHALVTEANARLDALKQAKITVMPVRDVAVPREAGYDDGPPALPEAGAAESAPGGPDTD
jgi:hypothetical protein